MTDIQPLVKELTGLYTQLGQQNMMIRARQEQIAAAEEESTDLHKQIKKVSQKIHEAQKKPTEVADG